ncbi:MAG: HlyD family efflux transporter periplasmic adaptor subunit [Hyphomicrobiales bacterium]|nr:HlyD family efflux transporter periplasmic adaptor subunit [Hyphomicrobiales bacterium]
MHKSKKRKPVTNRRTKSTATRTNKSKASAKPIAAKARKSELGKQANKRPATGSQDVSSGTQAISNPGIALVQAKSVSGANSDTKVTDKGLVDETADPQSNSDGMHSSVGAMISLLKGRRARQVIKSLIGILLIIAAGWAPAIRLFQVSSVEAVVNARVVTLRTPIEGVVRFQRDVNTLDVDIASGALVAKVENPRIDRIRINELTKDLDMALIEQDRLVVLRETLLDRRVTQTEQMESYRQIRLKTLKTHLDEASANHAEYAAKLANAENHRTRSERLLSRQVVATGRYQDVESEVNILKAGLERAGAQLRRTELEYKILASGGYFGDHFNDMPRSAIKIEVTEQQIGKVEADLSAQLKQVVSARKLLEAENDNLKRQEHASIVLPVSGRIWEPLVADGEQVVRGQPLLRMLDCANAVVTTAVSEKVYNSLMVGGTARFILRDSGREFPAVVAQLSGVSSAPANLAILPSALEKEPYRATVRVPDIGTKGVCLLGKTGRVVFSGQE